MIADAERHAKQVRHFSLQFASCCACFVTAIQTAEVARGMGALKAELAAAKRTEGSGGTPGRTSEIISMQRQILEKLPGLGSGGGGGDGAEVASLRHQLEQSRNDASDARSMVQQLRQQV